MRKNISSGTPWENTVGYSRAVRIDNIIEVAGTTATMDGSIIGKNDPYEQTKCCLEIIKNALEKAGGAMNNVVRTRMFVTDIRHWEAIGKAHGEYFKDIKPAATMVEVKSLIDPDLLVEIEATAVL